MTCQFWLVPNDGTHPPELDIFEIIGNVPGAVNYDFFWTANGTTQSDSQHYYTTDLSTAFHTYGCDWQADFITFYFDGVQTVQRPTPANINVPMFMIVSMSVGTSTSFQGYPTAGETYPQTYQIDRVTVWQNKPSSVFGRSGTYEDYFLAFANRETHGSFSLTLTPNYLQESGNSYPALGAYQFDKGALVAVGYYRDDGALSTLPWQDAFFTGLDGITSKAAYLNSPTIQTKSAHTWNQTVGWPSITNYGLQTYVKQTIGGIFITPGGLLGGVSLLGPDALKQFLQSNGATNPTDGYGTPISEYIAGLGGFATPFDPAG